MTVYKEIRQDREALVAAMQRGTTANVDGYEMGLRLYSDVSNVTLGREPTRHQGPCLIVQIDRQPRPSPELQQLASRHARAALAFAQEEPFWKEIASFYDRAPSLFAVTDEWLKGQQQ
jgi:hypothetical protein